MERDVLHVTIINAGGDELWQKKITTMRVPQPLELPRFGAVETKLRYDAPISVRDPATGKFSSLPYADGWDPQFKDIIVALPNGSRFVFWRGSSYIPFWASRYNVGLCCEWAEIISPFPPGATDCVEPLMDKELRYGRVEIVESTPARVHVRWTYQSNDLLYKVWGDQAVEDYYFYPDGFGTRVLTLQRDPVQELRIERIHLDCSSGDVPTFIRAFAAGRHPVRRWRVAPRELPGNRNVARGAARHAGGVPRANAQRRAGVRRLLQSARTDAPEGIRPVL